ncbi:transcriptional repressor [Limimaricola cinnabarinus]|uniref:Zinc uptake regulation protein ZUR n=1 Tax=Limimaricola cinnabarinus LL-001 TaxID=1337093 RepID=U2YZ70_9RHOB|nr:transcriptional repressor [Limimaricola cinnabarinus]GAD54132.1 zinc uptake regulation protein ZUR [Limimaricola cinnabarinus LL-001]
MAEPGFACGDHAACIRSAITAAEAGCAASGARLTPLRRRVLEILLEGHAAMGAYDVLARLDAEGMGSKPPVAYRALGFLVDQGLVHRIERLSAYVACARPGMAHAPGFLICRGCGAVAETQGAEGLSRPAAEAGFVIEQTVIEAEGLCPACQEREA